MSAGVSRRPSGPSPSSRDARDGTTPPASAAAATGGESAVSLSRADTLFIPAALFLAFFVIYALTATGFHTFDGIAYIRDMGKPLAAMVLPHHLIYEPAIFGFYNLGKALGWTGRADVPAQILSSLAGAGGVAVFYKLCLELSASRLVGLIFALLLAFTYGFWFYSVEVEIYVPPLFFLLVAAWLLRRATASPRPATALLIFVGLSHALAVLIHQAALFIVPTFALGIFLMPGSFGQRARRVVWYGLAMALVVAPAYIFAGVVVAGQNTPETFSRWVNNYGSLGTWGVWRGESLELTVSGLSAAVSSELLTGRLLVLVLLLLVLMRAAHITRRGGPFAWTLWAWFAIYGLFFAWWQPENLKFWVLMLPAPLALASLAFDWRTLRPPLRAVALASGMAAVALLLLTNAPTIWARRDPMSDPARRFSDELARLSGREDLIVLQAGNAEHHLPYFYDHINLMSTRELWYTSGGATGRSAAVTAIKERVWHALAKGANVWLEDRVLLTGAQNSDHYVFSPEEIDELLSPYGERVQPERVQAGPQVAYKLSPDSVFSAQTEWQFAESHEGWSGVNIGGERTGPEGWCFTPGIDPALYGPPLNLSAEKITQAEILISSPVTGTAQLFFRAEPTELYSEERSVRFSVERGAHYYTVVLKGTPGWQGVIRGLRLDPVEGPVVTPGVDSTVCVKDITVLQPARMVVDRSADTK